MRIRSRTGSRLLVAGGVGLVLAAREARRYSRRMDLRDKVVLITGGSRGLGLALAHEFAHEGCRIAICARDQEELDRAAAVLRKTDVEVMSVPCDITQLDQVERMIELVQVRFGRVDILVNNAGVIQVGPMESLTLEDFEQSMRTVFWGMVYPTLALMPSMRARRAGRIVNITSIGGKLSLPHLTPYGSAKFAAVGFSEGLTAELAKDGIRVTTVVPGLMRTGSFLNAEFKGREQSEFTWFSLSAALPGITISAESAARAIVNAAKYGDAEVILSLPAKIAALLHGLFPGLTAELMSVVNALLLPDRRRGENMKVRGMEIQQAMDSPTHQALTRLGQTAATELNERPGPSPRIEPSVARTPERVPEREPEAPREQEHPERPGGAHEPAA